jgi:processive 1,2-diacylglycerol beta-glucosyltransferase
VPTATVITDHTDHSYWIHPQTDRYIVGSERVKKALIAQGVASSAIAVTGIPVRSEFAREWNRQTLMDKHGLRADLPIVLVMGGGDGFIDKNLLRLIRDDRFAADMQFVVVCGRNRKLYETLERELADVGNRVKLHGFVPFVSELMAAADLLITKPGGLTTAEALAVGLPMLLYRPLPGQEEDNAAYLTEVGAAVLAASESELVYRLKWLLNHPEQLAEMRRRAQRLETKTAAFRALDAITQIQNPVFAVTFKSDSSVPDAIAR